MHPLEKGLLDCVLWCRSESYRTSLKPLRVSRDMRLLVVAQCGAAKYSGWKVLILDELAMKVMSAAVGMYDIMERKVTLVESLDKKRAPFPDMAAVYLIDPCEASVGKIVADFSTKPVLYGKSVFIYTLGRISDGLLAKIKGCKSLLKRLKALSELNINFFTREERVFDLDMAASFSSFYLRRSVTPLERSLADRLVTVCATLNEYPHIRFRQSSAVCSSLASIFHLKMDEFVAQNPTWWYHGGPNKGQQGSQRERATLLLLDRADDCLTPLMHDFHYQAMVHDLLAMEGDKITYQSEKPDDPSTTEAKDVLLNEKDNLWVELRGLHIAQVIETLSSRIREITNSSTGSTLGGPNKSKNMSLSQMASALKALPEYREVMGKLSQHMHLAHECMDKFKRNLLMDTSELEQTLATGKDEDGRSPKLSDLIDTAEDLIMKMNKPKDRLRLILIITISQGGLRQQDRRRLMNAAELTRTDMQTLNSLEILGLSIFSAGSEKKGLVSMLQGARIAASGQSDDEAEYAGSRFIPALKTVLEELANNSLSLDEYPSVLPMPMQQQAQSSSSSSRRGGSARSGKREATSARKGGTTSRWSKNTASKGSSVGPVNLSGSRNIVFMVGGLSYCELRGAREVMKETSREVILGSTALLSPNEYMDALETLGKQDE